MQVLLFSAATVQGWVAASLASWARSRGALGGSLHWRACAEAARSWPSATGEELSGLDWLRQPSHVLCDDRVGPNQNSVPWVDCLSLVANSSRSTAKRAGPVFGPRQKPEEAYAGQVTQAGSSLTAKGMKLAPFQA